MSLLDAVAIFAAGLAAGTINVIVGSGSLITFPTLLAVGYHPVVANVTNTVGVTPGSLSGVLAYRPELVGQRGRLVFLGSASLVGGITGAVLLLALPGAVFRSVVPVLILVACALIVVQPRVSLWLAGRGEPKAHGGPALLVGVFATGVYGGYFGAAQGVILMALLTIFIPDKMQRLNATKNVLATVANGSSAVVFILVAHVVWSAAAILAAGAIIGGQVGARVGRRIPAQLLRVLIVVVGVTVAITLMVE